MIGIVVIGKNEGARLERCLAALLPLKKPLVYVDSHSSDGSVPFAKGLKIEVIPLNGSHRCTSALARNLGFDRLLEIAPETTLIQFVDGDCELDPRWLEIAATALNKNERAAIIAGKLDEKDKDSSIYKTLSQIEWQHEVGEIDFTGGNIMIRVDAFRQVGGFNPDIVSGEDNDLCFRVRQKGWKILNLAQKMALHDSKVTTFAQFWERSMRTGYAYAQVSWEYWHQSQHMFRRELLSTLVWGGAFPLMVLLLAYPTGGWSLWLLLAYPFLFLKILRHSQPRWGIRNAALYAYACVLGKFPAFLGACKYYFTIFFRR